jgi:Family of unknown function (DUF5372)
VTHPFHPLYGQQFEILSYRHNWGEYRVTFYQTPDHVRALPASWTSLAPSDPSVVMAAGRAAFRVADLLLYWLLGTSVLAIDVLRLIERAFLSKCTTGKYNQYGSECIDFLPFCLF